MENRFDTVRLFMDKGANTGISDSRGCTALGLAAQASYHERYLAYEGRWDIVWLLIDEAGLSLRSVGTHPKRDLRPGIYMNISSEYPISPVICGCFDTVENFLKRAAPLQATF